MTGNADIADAVEPEIEAARGELIALCRTLVSAESMSPPGNTAAVAGIVRAFLAAANTPVETVAIDHEAPNVVGQVVGVGTGRHVVFNAHMDTMEIPDPAAWTVPPLRLSHRDGRLYGLGIGNMKGALAAMSLAMVLINRHQASLSGRLTLTAVSDEVMFGDRGAAYLLECRPDLKGDFLISGEGPGFMDLGVAEKGLLWIDVQARGSPGHASGARSGETAVMRLAMFLARLDSLNDVVAVVPGDLAAICRHEDDVGLRLSFNAGQIEAGTVRSQIPAQATARIDVRLPPGLPAVDVLNRIRNVALSSPGIEIAVIRSWDANWTELESPLVAGLVAAAFGVRGRPPRLVVRLPASDARRWRTLGVPAVCYGPQATLSAGIDEYAFEQDIVDCAKVYARTALNLMDASTAVAGSDA